MDSGHVIGRDLPKSNASNYKELVARGALQDSKSLSQMLKHKMFASQLQTATAQEAILTAQAATDISKTFAATKTSPRGNSVNGFVSRNK